VVAQHELRKALEHRHFHRLAPAGALPMEQGGCHGIDSVQSGDPVGELIGA